MQPGDGCCTVPSWGRSPTLVSQCLAATHGGRLFRPRAAMSSWHAPAARDNRIWRECDVSRGHLTNALDALETRGLVPSDRLQQWQQMSLDARLHNVLSPHLWRASADDLEFKRTSAMQVVATMSHLDSHVLPALNAQFLPGIRRLAVG